MKPVVLDLETTTRNKGDGAIGSFGGSPFSPHNFIVLLAEFYDRQPHLKYTTDPREWEDNPPFALAHAAAGNDVLLIGHNLSFDLAYLLKTWPELMDKARPHLHLWDTQQVEYLLSGQTDLFPSLDEVSQRRGLPLKDDRIKAYWNSGMDTTDIPQDELEEYGAQDVENPYYVYLDQKQEVEQDELLYELVLAKMDDLLMTAHMQYYGMHFDLVLADQKAAAIEAELAEVEAKITVVGRQFVPEEMEFNPGSPAQLSAVLFGGVVKWDAPRPILDEAGNPVLYKTGDRKGQVKTRITKLEKKIEGLGLPTTGIPPTAHGYSTADEVLMKLADKGELPGLIAKQRAMAKDVSTYYRGYAALVWPDGKIHPSINNEATVTGRQSVSQPNLQNVTTAED